MKHKKEIRAADQADLDLAAQMVKDGRTLRQRVLSRIRARVWRRTKNELANFGKNHAGNRQRRNPARISPRGYGGGVMVDRNAIFATLSASDVEMLWSKIEKRSPDECWPWKGKRDKNGYGRLIIRGAEFQSTRLVLALRHGFMPPPKTFACHSCDNPPCCNPSHLWWGTNSQNIADAAQKGRMKGWAGCRQGEKNPRAKLTTDQVIAIRKDGRVHRLIAADFGVSPSRVSDIKSQKAWQNLGVS